MDNLGTTPAQSTAWAIGALLETFVCGHCGGSVDLYVAPDGRPRLDVSKHTVYCPQSTGPTTTSTVL